MPDAGAHAPPPPELLAQWTSRVQARNGEPLCIRPLCPDDRKREIAFIASLSERTRYFRMMTPLKYLSRHMLEHFMDIDYDRRMAFAAVHERDGLAEFVGIARYGEAEETGVVELGITVTDAWQRHGVARLLITELLRFAAFRGHRKMIGMVLPDNARMLALARSMGFRVSYDSAGHVMMISRDLLEAPVAAPPPIAALA